jgi:RHS repeat-associated protein
LVSVAFSFAQATAPVLITPSNDRKCCFATVGTGESRVPEDVPTGFGDGCTMYDHTPPTNVTLVATVNGANIALSWGANASVARLNHYDVDVRVDEGVPQSVVSNTTTTSTTYAAAAGHYYVFIVTATDNAGNSATPQTAAASANSARKYYVFGGKRVAMRADGVVYYLHADHLGSTSLVTTGAGAVVARQLYLPYGTPRWITGTLPTDFTFTGQRVDATGLMFYRARYYSSSLGRFVSPDTIIPNPANPQLFNRYSYAGNNPVLYTDPTGHCFTPFCVGEVALVVGVAALLTSCTSPLPVAMPAATSSPPLPLRSHDNGSARPNIFAGDPNDVAEAWALLDRAKEYGPNTRQLIESRITALQRAQSQGSPTMRIQLVRKESTVLVGEYSTGAIDLNDIEGLRDDLYNPLSPANAMLYEFVEQYEGQINRRRQRDAHSIATDAENLANSERYAAYPGGAPVRAMDELVKDKYGRIVGAAIVYRVTRPELAGRTKARVIFSLPDHSSRVEWSQP